MSYIEKNLKKKKKILDIIVEYFSLEHSAVKGLGKKNVTYIKTKRYVQINKN